MSAPQTKTSTDRERLTLDQMRAMTPSAEARELSTSTADRLANIAASKDAAELGDYLNGTPYGHAMAAMISAVRHNLRLDADSWAQAVLSRECSAVRHWLSDVSEDRHRAAVSEMAGKAKDYINAERMRLSAAWRLCQDPGVLGSRPAAARELVTFLYAYAAEPRQGPRVMVSHRVAVHGIMVMTGTIYDPTSVGWLRKRGHLDGIAEVTPGKAGRIRTTVYDLLPPDISLRADSYLASHSTSPICDPLTGLVELGGGYPLLNIDQRVSVLRFIRGRAAENAEIKAEHIAGLRAVSDVLSEAEALVAGRVVVT